MQEGQCISVISFGNQASDASDPDLLDCPIWILVINIVAMEMLRAKLPPGPARLTTGRNLLPNLVTLLMGLFISKPIPTSPYILTSRYRQVKMN